MENKTNRSATYSRFACIGAGFSGIGIGATLKRWYGITDIQIFEREADLGGTWFINKYPGTFWSCFINVLIFSFFTSNHYMLQDARAMFRLSYTATLSHPMRTGPGC